MKKLMTNEVVLKDRQVAVYLDKYGILHASRDTKKAMENGRYLITDECGVQGGYLVIDGIRVKVYGAGDGWVYLSDYAKENDIKNVVLEETYRVAAGGSVSISRKSLTNAEKAAYRKANELYRALDL